MPQESESSLLYFSDLNAGDAQQISALEKRLHRPENREGEEFFRTLLTNADRADANLSLGLYRGDDLVGYIVVYLRSAGILADSKHAPVAYVHDILLLPDYGFMLRQLIRKAAQNIRLFAPEAPIEAHYEDERLGLYRACDRFRRGYGYRPALLRPPDESSFRPRSHRAQWRPDPDYRLSTRSRSAEARGIKAEDISVEVVTNEGDWWRLRSDWDAILEQVPDHTVFQKFDYLWTWWQYLGLASELLIFVARDGDRVIGIAPFETRPSRIMRKWFRELCLLGTPWEVDRARIMVPPDSYRCLPAIASTLLEHRHSWDLGLLWEQSPDDPVAEFLRQAFLDAGLLMAETRTSPCPYIELEGSWPDYLATRSRRLRKNLRRSRRQLEALGKLEYVELRDPQEIELGMYQYEEVEARSWKPAQGLGIGRNKRYQGFYHRVAQLYSRQQALELRFLTLDDTPIAATFGIRHDGTFHSMRITHDRAYDKYSPGTLLESLELESLFDSDLDRYDFLGGFLSNKTRWTESIKKTVNIHLFTPQNRLRLFHLIYFRCKPAAKEILKSLGLFEPLVELHKKLQRSKLNKRLRKLDKESEEGQSEARP